MFSDLWNYCTVTLGKMRTWVNLAFLIEKTPYSTVLLCSWIERVINVMCNV